MFVRSVVVDDQVNVKDLRALTVDLTEKPKPLLMTMARHALGDDLPFEDLHGSEQSGGAMALVVMGHRAAAAALQRQARLRTIERLNLTLLISGEDKSTFRRVQIQSDHIDELYFEMRIIAHLERTRSMGLQPVGLPDPLHSLMGRADLTSQRTAAPVRRVARLLPSGLLDNLSLHAAAVDCRSPSTRSVLFDARQSELGVSLPPQTNGLPVGSDPSGDRSVLMPGSR